MSAGRALCIGHFDGVHLGHAALVRRARHSVGPDGHVTALSFDPHPLSVLRPADAPPRLSSFEQRSGWLRDVGADEVTALSPDRALLSQTPEAFLTGVVERLEPTVIVEGADFRFGRDRAGSIQTIRDHAAALGYSAIVVPEVEQSLVNHTVVAVRSSLIRWLVACGRVRDAAILLGRPYELRGEVVRGEGRGGPGLGVPTANLAHGDMLLPADGVYAGTAVAPDGSVYPAAISVGTKPTFGDLPRVCEVHLIGFDGTSGAYGWQITLAFGDWLRDQITYTSAGPLIDQIARDIERTREAVSDLAATA